MDFMFCFVPAWQGEAWHGMGYALRSGKICFGAVRLDSARYGFYGYMKGRMTLNKQEKVKALVEVFANEDYGKTIEHFKIAAIIGETYGTPKYQEIVTRAKKELLDSGKMIASVHGIGYRLVYPDEYTDQSARCVVSGARRIDKGVHILDSAPVKDMTQTGAQKYNTVADRMRIMQAAVHGAKVEIKMLTAKRKNPLLEAVQT